MKFRYDINALRAIAVLSVLFFHFKVPGFTGGFSGVDVFFVISGYLMSRIILTSIEKGDFSILDFYGKRLKRIVPALLFLVIAVTSVTFFIYFPNDFKEGAKNAGACLLFVSNILYFIKTNYFDAASETNIWLHTWSLSVEWQFYLLYPVILVLLSRVIKKRSQYLAVFIVVTLISLIATVIVTRIYPTATFYLFPFRAWEMLIGGIAFLVEAKVKQSRHRKLIAITGYIVILLSAIFLNADLSWPGLYTVIPVIATFCVITANYNDNKIMGNESIDFLGRISYSLYLWHWPVFVIAHYLGLDWNALSIILMIGVSFLLGYFSYRHIEKFHFINSRFIVTAAVVLALGAFTLSRVNANIRLFDRKALEIVNYEKNHKKEVNTQFTMGCFLTNSRKGLKYLNKEKCLNFQENKVNVLLIGDSHAADISQTLKDSLAAKNINLMLTSATGCLPVIKPKGQVECLEVINYLYNDFIPENAARIDGIMISASWVKALKNGDKQALVGDIQNTLNYLSKYKIPVILIGQTETYTISYATIAAKEYAAHKQLSDRFINKSSGAVNNLLGERFNSIYVDIYNSTIPQLLNNSTPYMFDDNHYTKYGAGLAVHKIITNPITQKFINRLNQKSLVVSK
jgi:peptidoglycan/LPS O-acetylase OafA/YrhL